MKALLCHSLTGVEGLKVGDVETPAADPGTVLIQIHAGALNFPDLLMTQGKYQFRPDLPFVAGGEGSGIIIGLGEGVTSFSVGDPVLFMSQVGAFAEKIAVPQHLVMPLPKAFAEDRRRMDQAAGLTITYGTTLHGLKDRGQLKPGETLLVLGAAGGVGMAAVEVGKAMGARVIAAASNPEKLALADAAGADILIDYSIEGLKAALNEATGGHGVDVIYDPVGGDFSEQAFRSMAPGGRHLVIGFAAGDIPKIPLNLCLLKQASLVGVFWGAWAQANPKDHMGNMQMLFKWMEGGQIKPYIGARYGLDDAVSGYADLAERRARGKILIAVEP